MRNVNTYVKYKYAKGVYVVFGPQVKQVPTICVNIYEKNKQKYMV